MHADKGTDSFKKKPNRRKKRILLGLLVLLAVLFMGGILTVHTSKFRTYILSKIDQRLRKDFNYSLSAKSLDLNLFRLSASFDDLKISPLAPDKSILQNFSAQRLSVNLSSQALFGKRIHIQKFHVTAPEIQLSTTKRALPLTKKVKTARNKTYSFQIDDFLLENGTIDYQNKDYPIAASVSDIAIDIHFQKSNTFHQGRLTAQAGEFDIYGSRFSLDKFLTELTFDDRSIQVTRLLCETEPFSLSATGQIQNYQQSPQILFAIEGKLRMNYLNELSEIGHGFAGILSFKTSIDATGSDVALDGHIQAKDILVADIPLKTLEGDFQGDRTRVALDNLIVEDSSGSLKGQMVLSLFEKGDSTAAFNWSGLRLKTLERWMPDFAFVSSTGISGSVAAKWRERTLDSLDLKGDIRLEPLPKAHPIAGENIDLEGDVSFQARGGILTVFPSSVRLNQTALEVSGILIPPNQFKLAYQLKSKDLKDTKRLLARSESRTLLPESMDLSRLQVDGQLLLSGEAAGSFDRPEATLTIAGRDIILNTHEIGKVDAELTYKERTIDIISLSIGEEQGGITMDGQIDIDPFQKSLIPSAMLKLKASDLDIAPFTSLTQQKYAIQGALSGEAALSGTLTDPTIQFFWVLNNFVVNKENFSSVRIRGQYLKQKLSLEEFDIVKNDAFLRGSLGLDLAAQTFDIDCEGHAIDLSSFRTINTGEKTIQGKAQFRIKGSGTVENPVFSLELSMENISAQSVWVGSLILKAASDGRVVNIRLDMPLGQTSVEAKLNLEEPYLLEGKLHTESLDIWHAMRSELEPLPSPISSQISATADFVIPLKDWTNIILSVNLIKGSFRYKDFMIETPQPILAKIQNRRLIIEDFAIQGPQTEFSVAGSLPLTERQAGHIEIKGSLDIRLLEALYPGTEASGVLDIKGSLSGSVLEPTLNGSMKMENGQYVSPLFPVSFKNISFKSEIKDNVFHLDRFFIGVGSGNVSARGTIFLSPLLARKTLAEPLTQTPDKNELIVSLNELDIADFSEILKDKLGSQVGGRIDGVVRVHGDFTSISRLEMDGELKRLEFSLDEFKMSNEEKILFRSNNGILYLNKFRLSGGQSFVQAEGEMSLQPEARINARLSASLDTAVLSSLVEDAVLGGNLSLDLHLTGDLKSPTLSGQGTISDGFFQMQEPSFLITNFNGTLDFPDTETVLLSLEGIVNGGKTNINGKINYRSFAIVSTRFEVKTVGVQVNYPEGFQAIADGTLTLEKKEKEWFLGGGIKINQSYYNADIYPGGELINSLRKQRRALRSDIPPSIRSIKLDIDFSTVDAFIIENNLVDLELDAGIRVSGTLFDPRLSGFVRNRQTGQIIFGNHEYEVEQAILNFQDVDPLEGQLSIVAHTQIPRSQIPEEEFDLDVTMTITGPITTPQVKLISSSKSYSEIELASLLITGYPTAKLRADAAGIIGDQLMLYFLTPFASPLTHIVKNLIGAEEVSIEPIYIAPEADPGARFTFRKRLIQALDLIYSIDISNTQNQTWVLDYNFTKNFGIQSFARDDGSYGGSFSHRFFLGSPGYGKNTRLPLRYKQLTIKDIQFEGDLIFAESELRRMSRSLKVGSIFSYKDMRKTIDALETFYKMSDYLNAIIKPRLIQDNADSITIVFSISPNSPAVIAFEGDPLSKKLKSEVAAGWNGRLPDEMSASQAKKLILRYLNGKGHLDAVVSHTKMYTNGTSVYAFSTSQGPKYRVRNFIIKGKSSLPPKMIKSAISGIPKAKGKGVWVLWSDFKRAKLRIESLFAEYGYQDAAISRPQVSFDRNKNVIDITLPIDQGDQSRISSIQITGNSAFTDADLKKAMILKEESVFSPIYLASDSNTLYSLYRSNGFHDVRIDTQMLSGPDAATIDLLYTIHEGEIYTVSSIEVYGNQRTPEHVIRRELTFKEGDILRTRDLIASQKKLYDLMIFKAVNIRREEHEGQRRKARILVEIQEDPRFAVSYGLRYNSEEKLEVFGQLGLINIFGRGSNGLFFYRQNERQKDFRFSLKVPYLFDKRFNTLLSFFTTEETESFFKSEESGVTVQQQLKMPYSSSLAYLFRINQIHTYELDPIGPFPFDIKLFLPEFQTFLIRDTRTSLLNAKHGSFLSLSLTYSPEFLKTDLKYISFFGQYSFYLPISSQVTWASNYRIGLADAFDQVLIPSRRFFAGGANSIRGFERNTVGPYDSFFQDYTGGEALFIVNQELRFPLFKWLEGVAFFDVGNVYENLGDFNPLDLRTGAGFGLRLNLPAIFLRLDYGINLAPRENERKSVIYFSIGQAF